MNKTVWRWIGLGAAVSLMLVYFIELASNGLQKMEGAAQIDAAYNQSVLMQEELLRETNMKLSVNNSMPATLEDEIAQLESEILSLKKKALQEEKKQLEQMLLSGTVEQSNVNKLADTTSGALQKLSSSSMEFVAKLFHNVIN